LKYVVTIFFLFLFRVAQAQTCTGGLGDPIVNITFGQGAGPGPALAPGITNLAWITDDCPDDGQYKIVNHTSGCWNGTWITIPQDHTGDTNGYFMLINASFNPSDFYVQRVDGLCGGTSYQFAAWIMNIGIIPSQIRPNITFRIEKTDGTVLQGFNTGDIPLTGGSAKWNQYAFYFDTPIGVSSVVIRMINNAPGGSGNDLALDDITFRAAGPSIKTAVAGFSNDTISLCQGDPQILHFSSVVENCFPSAAYEWQVSKDGGLTWSAIPGESGQTYDRPATAPGNYLYRMAVAHTSNAGITSCSVASLPVLVRVIPLPFPAVTISSTPYFCAGHPAVFTAATTDGGSEPSYQWKLNGGNVTAGVGAGDTVFTIAVPVSKDVVSCVMTSNAACVIDPVVFSNTLSVPVIPIPITGVDIAASADHVCADSLVRFTAQAINGGAAPFYEWMVNGAVADTSGPAFATRLLKDGDRVACTMTGSLTCSLPVTAPEVIQMTVYPLPTLVLRPDTIIAGGASIRLAPVLSGDIVQYQWSPVIWLDDPTVAEPVATPVSTTAYRLEVVTPEGCRATGVEKIGVYYDLQMPGAFTPNGDGHNDVFRVPPSIPVNVLRLSVFNRQGAMVFSTANVSRGWDGSVNGKGQPAGVYVWMIEYENPLTKRVEMKKGTVILVR
jgi:gliding motility-associated-like protein